MIDQCVNMQHLACWAQFSVQSFRKLRYVRHHHADSLCSPSAHSQILTAMRRAEISCRYLNLDLHHCHSPSPYCSNKSVIHWSASLLRPIQSADRSKEGRRREWSQSSGYSGACRACRNLYAACQYEILMMAGGWASLLKRLY